MRFEFEVTDTISRITPIFEDDDTWEGERAEDVGNFVTFSGQAIDFHYPVKSIHPDLLGLMCLAIFHPFIGSSVTFPEPVSPRLKEAFENECFKKTLKFQNIDPEIQPYEGKNIAISFGGGVDSSAVREVFPEAIVVHEAHIREGKLVKSHAHEVVNNLPDDRGYVIASNQRYVSTPGGWHGWTCSTLTSVLMATDFNIGIVLTGSILGSTLLSNGKGYWDRFRARGWHGPTGNYWQSAFQRVGLPMFSPMTGASEFITMDASLDLLGKNEVVYCMENDGNACHKCTKCFRRAVIRSVVEPGYDENFERYDISSIHAFLDKRPLYFGHVFSFARKNGSLPSWINDRIADVPNIKTDWPIKLHPNVYDFVESPWNEMIRERMQSHYPEMNEDELHEMENWTQI